MIQHIPQSKQRSRKRTSLPDRHKGAPSQWSGPLTQPLPTKTPLSGFVARDVFCITLAFATLGLACRPSDHPSPQRTESQQDSNFADDPAAEETFREVVGSLPGQVSVNNFGAASYAIEVDLPPGTGGVQPELKLRYDSRSEQNGILGTGWSIDGLSAIFRTPSTLFHDDIRDPVDFDNYDRLSLNGQRLRAVTRPYWSPGSVYQTEIDSFVRITLNDNSFSAATKSGLIMSFGSTEESRFPGPETPTLLWELDRVSDTLGNYMVFDYETSAERGEQHIRRIRYTGHESMGIEPDNALEFIYEPRPDVSHKYSAGVLTTLSKRLSRIVVKLNDEVVHEYRFTYKQSPVTGVSQLVSVRHVSGETSADGVRTSLKPTRFEWRSGNTLVPPQGRLTPLKKLGSATNSIPHGVHATGDFDGDGRADFITGPADTKGRIPGDTKDLITHLSTNNHVGAPAGIEMHTCSSGPKKVIVVGDFNGDGLSDFMVACVDTTRDTPFRESRGTYGSHYIYAAEPGGTFTRKLYRETNNVLWPQKCGKIRGSADFNGDGATDILFTNCILFSEPSEFRMSQTSWTFRDVRMTDNVRRAFRATDQFANQYGLRLMQFFVGEINGDRNADLIFELILDLDTKHKDGDEFRVQILTLAGDGKGRFTLTEDLRLLDWKYGRVQSAADFNGDGLTDLLLAEQSDNFFNPEGRISKLAQVLLSTGDGTFQRYKTNIKGGLFGARIYYPIVASSADFNGDGSADVLLLNKPFDKRIGSSAGAWMYRRMTPHSLVFERLQFPLSGGHLIQATGDFNGDSRTDVITAPGDNHGRIVDGDWRRTALDEVNIDRVTKIENGIGRVSEISYRRATNVDPASGEEAPVYIKGRGAEYPLADVQSSMIVVSKVSEDTGLSPPHALNDVLYTYAHARVDRMVRGFLGFQIFESYDVRRNLSVHETLSQTFPHIGTSLEKNTCLHNGPEDTDGQLLKRRTNVTGDFGTNFRNVTVGTWTPWLDRDDPSGSGDYETTALHYKDGSIECENPLKIHCATTDKRAWHDSGDIAICNPTEGLVCKWQDQADRSCEDYHVRFFCGEVVPTLTTSFPYIASSREETWELGKGPSCSAPEKTADDSPSPYDTVRTTNTFDQFGNNIRLVTTWDEGLPTQQRQDIRNEFSQRQQWIRLGRLLKSTIIVSGEGIEEASRTTVFTYNEEGLVESQTQEAFPRLTTHHSYDVFGNVTKKSIWGDGLDRRESMSFYDDRGRFEKCRTNALGHMIYREHDPRFGKVSRLVGANEMSVQGLNASCPDTVSENAVSTTHAYDPFGRLSASVEARSQQMRTRWEVITPPTDDLVLRNAVYKEVVEQTGQPSVFKFYDRLGRELRTLTVKSLADSTISDTRYDAYGRPVLSFLPYNGFQDERPLSRRLEYDALGRVIRATEPSGVQVETVYDGRKTTLIKTPVEATIKPRVSTSIIDARGRVIQSIDQLGQSISFWYDGFGNLIRTQPTTDGKLGRPTQYGYDDRGNRSSVDDPNLGFRSYVHNAAGEMTSVTNATGDTTSLEYDPLGRLTHRTAPEGVSTWIYDQRSGQAGYVGGLLFEQGTSLSDDGRSFYYDQFGRVTSTQQAIEGLLAKKNVEYDQYGRTTSESYELESAGQSVEFLNLKRKLSVSGQLVSIQDQDGHVWFDARKSNGAFTLATPLGYDAMDRPTHYRVGASVDVNGSGISVEKRYHHKSKLLTSIKSTRLSALQDEPAGTLIQDNQYVYDSLGSLVMRRNFLRTERRDEAFSYDELNRLTESRMGNQSVLVRYDGSGNISHKSDVGDYFYGHKDSNQLHRFPHAVVQAGSQRSLYNKNGQMVIRGEESLVWSSFSKVLWMGNETTQSSFEYDAQDRRIKSVRNERIEDLEAPVAKEKWAYRETNKTYFEPEFEVVEVSEGICEVRESQFCQAQKTSHMGRIFVSGPDGLIGAVNIDSKGSSRTKQYFLKDHIGTITKLVETDGTVAMRYDYDAWGKRRDPKTGQPFALASDTSSFSMDRGFTGQEMLDAHELIHLNGRVYDPTIGRFLSADPFVAEELDLQNHNRYSYVLNRPLTLTDPSGYSALGATALFIAAVIEAIQVVSTYVAIYMSIRDFVNTLDATGDVGLAFTNLAIAWGTTAITYGIGTGIDSAFAQSSSALTVELARATAHGVWQGAYNEVSGQGSFSTGAIAGATASLVGHLGINRLPPALRDSKFLSTMVVGAASGTAAKVGGGKFMNGFSIGTTVHRHNAQREENGTIKSTKALLKKARAKLIKKTGEYIQPVKVGNRLFKRFTSTFKLLSARIDYQANPSPQNAGILLQRSLSVGAIIGDLAVAGGGAVASTVVASGLTIGEFSPELIEWGKGLKEISQAQSLLETQARRYRWYGEKPMIQGY